MLTHVKLRGRLVEKGFSGKEKWTSKDDEEDFYQSTSDVYAYGIYVYVVYDI